MSGRLCRTWLDTTFLGVWSIVLSASLGKMFFAWDSILNENILFSLTISYQKPFAFSVSVFCSQMFTLKLNLCQKFVWPCNFYRKVIFFFFFFFFKFLCKTIFFTFLCWIWSIDVSHQHCENFRKTVLVENLPPSYLPYTILHSLHSFLLWEKGAL